MNLTAPPRIPNRTTGHFYVTSDIRDNHAS